MRRPSVCKGCTQVTEMHVRCTIIGLFLLIILVKSDFNDNSLRNCYGKTLTDEQIFRSPLHVLLNANTRHTCASDTCILPVNFINAFYGITKKKYISSDLIILDRNKNRNGGNFIFLIDGADTANRLVASPTSVWLYKNYTAPHWGTFQMLHPPLLHNSPLLPVRTL